MALQPVARKPVSELVHDQLSAEILGGEIEAGASLPSERELAETFGVNRHAVREALKRLQQAGLVEVAHGGATRVLDWRTNGGLDLLTRLPLDRGDMIRSAFEMRVSLGADVARRCAERAPAGLAANLAAAADAVDAAAGQPELSDRYSAFWALLVDGAENVAYRLAFNSLVVAAHGLGELSHDLHADEHADTAGRRKLVQAVAERDARAAERAARRLLERTLAAAEARSHA
jgi:GntR family transcriptional regulator, transcriptional repressor for pyruvate dehydrogenase complex